MVAMVGSNQLRVLAFARHSLSPRGRRLLLIAFFLVSLVIALAFALLGAWPIIPFTGLEWLVVVLALRAHARAGRDFESLRVDDHRLVVDLRRGERRIHREFNTCWTQIGLHCGRGGHHCRLTLRAHGRELEFGRLLSDEERSNVASLLTRHAGLQPLT
jgi:uncharacterized membrane protein